MLRAFQIELNKLITFVCKLFGYNSTVFPGSITYNIRQNILTKIKYPKYVIGVTGSSGKGTTTDLIATTLKEAGLNVVYNASGSNGIRAITTTILNNCNIFGKMKCDVLLLEIDERHLHLAFSKNKMTHLVITNITRDQPARNGSPDLIYDYIFKTLDGSTTLVINGDDPTVSKCKISYPGKVITYGLDKTKDSFTINNSLSIDSAYCPKCHSKLKYEFYHYGHIGSYECTKCDFKRNPLDFEAKDLDLENKTITINDKPYRINKNILYAAYNTLGAYALCKTISISDEILDNTLNKHIKEAKRAHKYQIENKNITMLESKNENCLSYYQSIKYIIDQKGKKTIILGFDNVSRRYKFNDLSWLYDVDFELLNDNSIESILCIGRFKYDVANRLKYAGIDKNKIILVDDIKNILKTALNKDSNDIYTMVCFDMTAIIKNQIKEALNERN
jgi:UDP-N-acetylmuramyl pentapeptide synthase